MKFSFNNYKTYFIFLTAVCIAVNLISEIIAEYEFEKFAEQNNRLLEDMSFRDKLSDLRSDVLLIESRVRGAVVTGKEEFIFNIDNNYLEAYRDLNEIIEKTNLDTGLKKMVDSLNVLTRHKIQISKQIVDVYNQKGKTEAEKLIGTGLEKKLRENILSIALEIDTFKYDEIAQAKKLVETQKERADYSADARPFISTISLIILGLLLTRKMRKREKAFVETTEIHTKERSAYLIKDQFISNISHEVRTPLNSVIGYCSLLQKTDLSKAQHGFVNAIQTSGESLLQIINELLDFGKIQEGSMAVKKDNFHIPELVGQVSLMFQEAFKKKGLEFLVLIDESIPNELSGDVTKLRQVLVNLINNALKFTHRGKVEIQVNQKKGSTTKQVVLEIQISDTGIGIDKEHLPRIFERFYQVESGHDRRYGGTGLGLAIIHQLIQIMGGSIRADSTLGKGTKFLLELPFDVSASSPMARQRVTIRSGGNMIVRVLVVDDNVLNRELTMHLLSTWGFEVLTVESGRKAIDRLRNEKFDLVLMDIQMPEMDGYETTEKIKAEFKTLLPIVALTAHSNKTEREKCMRAGMSGYISKPFDELELYKIITELVQQKNDHTSSIISLDYLKNISKGNKEFEKRILTRFVNETPLQLAELKTGIQKQDTSGVRKAIHNMKANVSIVGLNLHLEEKFDLLTKHDLTAQKGEAEKLFIGIEQTINQCIAELRTEYFD